MRASVVAAATAVALLAFAACGQSTVDRANADRNASFHANAPAVFKLGWDRYQTQTQGRFGIFALDKRARGMGWVYCVQACGLLLDSQNQAVKSLWAQQALGQCGEAVQKNHASKRPDCAIYAIRDEVV